MSQIRLDGDVAVAEAFPMYDSEIFAWKSGSMVGLHVAALTGGEYVVLKDPETGLTYNLANNGYFPLAKVKKVRLLGGGGKDTIRCIIPGMPTEISGFGGDDLLQSYSGNDTLDGGEGDDKLLAGTGDDVLKGGPGTDTLRADAGKDTVVRDKDDTLINVGPQDVIEWNAAAAVPDEGD